MFAHGHASTVDHRFGSRWRLLFSLTEGELRERRLRFAWLVLGSVRIFVHEDSKSLARDSPNGSSSRRYVPIFMFLRGHLGAVSFPFFSGSMHDNSLSRLTMN